MRAPVRGLHAGVMPLSRELARYLTRVLRLGLGDRVIAFDPDQRLEADATLASSAGEPGGEGAWGLEVGPLRAPRVVAARALVVLQGLAKGDKMDAVVRDATELGATQIVCVEAERSVVRLEGKRREERAARLAKVAEEAARQCGRADPPRVLGPMALEAAARLAPPGGRFALAPGAPEALGAHLCEHLGDALTFAVGPEGGFSEAELRALEGLGFRRVSLGGFVLRTETAVAAVLGAVRVLEPPA